MACAKDLDGRRGGGYRELALAPRSQRDFYEDLAAAAGVRPELLQDAAPTAPTVSELMALGCSQSDAHQEKLDALLAGDAAPPETARERGPVPADLPESERMRGDEGSPFSGAVPQE
jgi:hypothetical protein